MGQQRSEELLLRVARLKSFGSLGVQNHDLATRGASMS
jgi:hypothetical protein